jgi:REP element-mobilizing transposase RayT
MPRYQAPRRNTSGEHPLAYLVTFTTYGSWLHGDERGSIDAGHAAFESPRVEANLTRYAAMAQHMRSRAVLLDARLREAVESAIRDVCEHKGWRLEAINVRTNHVHVVVGAPIRPEVVLTSFKAWATRRCRAKGLLAANQKLWTRHGSTRYLWTERDIQQAATYVVEAQGEPLPRGPDVTRQGGG